MKLENVKVGDPIAVREHGAISRRLVSAVFKTRVWIGDSSFSRANGKLTDGGYAIATAEPWTAETAQEAELQPLRSMLENYPWRSATKEQAEAVLAVLKAHGMPTAGC